MDVTKDEVPVPGTPEAAQADGGAALPASGTPVGKRFVATVTIAFFGTWLALLPSTTVTLALRVQQIAPGDKTSVLSMVLAVGAAVALIAQNLFGALSDRTTSRFGMRRPWIAGGALLGLGGLVLLAAASTVWMLLLAWCLVQLLFNVLLAGLNPVLPDHVPSRQLGKVSALAGLTQQLGIVGGVFLVQLLLPDLTLAIVLPGVVCLAAVAVFLPVLKDRRLTRSERRPLRARDLLLAYWTNPRKAPDFAWAWVSRFLVTAGNFTLSSYQTYFLMDRFGYTPATIGSAVFRVLLATSIAVVATSLVFGAVSDRIGRRKVFVLVSAIVLALAHILAACAASFTVFLVAAVIGGVATGCYIAVDMALVAEVLPSRADAGKDMGVFHLANVLPQTLVPAVAPAFLAIGGGRDNYPAFFIAGAVAGVLGAIANQRIRTVR
ncbi:MFS transporter [Streptomyces sp. NPDC101225]|uniref:MFS transporter n=1 Tax=Streptomyces sp. NPDC101225 TaxID=3366135 RepID=UPI00380E4CFE